MKQLVYSLALLVASLAAGAAQAAVPADPWTMVPPLPTACFGKQDDFDELVAQRLDTLAEEADRQTAVNEELAHVQIVRDSAGNVDPWEMSRRMTESAMKDPQNAGKMLGEANQAAQDNQQASAEQEQKERDRKEALAALFARYDSSLDAATAGISSAHPLGVTGPLGDGVSPNGGSWYGGNTTDYEGAIAFSRKVDQIYETRFCPQWWQAGPFHTWLAGYRAFLVADIPRQEDVEAKTNASLKTQGVNLDGYHSTVKMQAVKKFLLAAQETFQRRWEHPGQPPT